jgi:hypothetical protein
MKICVEKEHDNCRQTMELDEEITEIEEDLGLLRVYTNVGENPSHYACVEFGKNEIESIISKFQELKDKIRDHNNE